MTSAVLRNGTRLRWLGGALACWLFVAIAGCSSGPGTGTTKSVAPTITTQPASVSVTVGAAATFSVVASGTQPLSYQWQKNQQNISGANGATYTTPATISADNGSSFRVIVSNGISPDATSAAATLTVTAAPVAPTITTQPQNAAVTVGQTATFTVVATGTAPLHYQWQKNQQSISGANGATYTTPATISADNGSSFRVIVSNGTTPDATSANATLTVNAAPVAPTITTQPQNATVTSGQTATFTVVATGTAPLHYQWQKNQQNISGATSASYRTPVTTTGDNGATFRVIVSNGTAPDATSANATLTVNAAPLAPTITTQPQNAAVTVGQTATFTVVATGTAPLHYQWQKNQQNVSGATSASYTTPATTTADNGAAFRVIVSNGTVPDATSANATLTVNPVQTSSVNVLTYHNDNARTGQNLNETILTTANVNSTTFGKLATLAVSGNVDAEPLYVSNLTVNGAGHNVVFVVTEQDMAYAFDADTFAQLWSKSVGNGESPAGMVDGCSQVEPKIGVTSTPVIDLSAGPHGTMFLVAMTQDSGGNYHQRLHALDLTTGNEQSGSPVAISATYTIPGTSTTDTFNSMQYKERAGLLLMNGTIYLGWASHCDVDPYQGWIMAYSETTLQPGPVLNITPSGSSARGAIWMANTAMNADSSGNIYFLAANGVFGDGSGNPPLTSGFP
ncbi:MAG: immunoglobulin domain-containing protein, partial [Candidatus Acidiferrales bacterium]